MPDRPDFDDCLRELSRLATSGDSQALELMDEPIGRLLDEVGPDRAAQVDALYQLIAAFIGRVTSTRLSETMTERLVERRSGLMAGTTPVVRPHADAALPALIQRLAAVERIGASLRPSELTLTLKALRFYLTASPDA